MFMVSEPDLPPHYYRITATETVLSKLKVEDKDLDDYSLGKVKMFENDASHLEYKL